MQDHFSAGVIFAFDQNDLKWKTIGATDMRFSDGVKISGGTNKDDNKVLLNETPEETLEREIKEETNLTVSESILAHSYVIPGRIPGTMHARYFYLVKGFSGSFPFDSERNILDGKDEVKTRWWGLEEFEVAIFKFPNHKEGYIKAFLEMANLNENFRRDNAETFARYSAMKFK
jgi:ADP-ribose pyrophosphatase YjhB (NUDIX family)